MDDQVLTHPGQIGSDRESPPTADDEPGQYELAIDDAQLAPRPRLLSPTGIHPGAVWAAAAAQGLFMFASWIAFGSGQTALWLYFATLISAIYLGLMGLVGASSHFYPRQYAPRRSFAEFLDGDVSIHTGTIRGREALIQIAAPSAIVALCGFALAVIWMVEGS
jgi:hypothetical protein